MPRFVFLKFVLLFAVLVPLFPPRAATAQDQPETILVDAAKVVRQTDHKLLGVNLNYLLDNDANRKSGARPLAKAILDMGAGTLRYPGGAKSDVTLWAAPPFARPGPTLARVGADEWPSNDARVYDLSRHAYKTRTLDFDAFIALCRATGAEPVVVVAHDSMYRPGKNGSVAPDMAELLENAVSWVRYANVVRGYGVKYWEIGNESYLDSYDGGARAADYARDLILFGAAMKGVDPGIKIGANGPALSFGAGELDAKNGDATPWWKTVFEQAAGSIDFVSVHEYPCLEWYGYDYYRKNPVKMVGVAEIDKAARQYGPPGLAGRLRYLLTELNSADWYGHPQNLGWKHENTLGHALVLFDMLGQAISDPRVVTAEIWATRWMQNSTAPQLWDALDARNRLLPTGMAVKLWQNHLGTRLVAATGTDAVRAFAAYDAKAGRLSVFLLNKDAARPVAVSLAGGRPNGLAARLVWSGTGPDDRDPRLHWEEPVRVARGATRLELPAVSLTVLSLSFAPEDQGKLRAAVKPHGNAAYPKG